MPSAPSLFPTRHGATIDIDAALGALRDRDVKLRKLIDRIGPFRLEPPAPLTPFAYLLRAIVYQQLSGKAAGTIHGRVQDLFRTRHPTPKALLATPSESLRAAGLSAAKTLAVLDLARHALDGTIPDTRRLGRLEDSALIERLTKVRGVGPWTVEMLLIFYLGRPDVLPRSDLGIRQGYVRAIGRPRRPDRFGLPQADEMSQRAERWRPYRSIASWYLWRAMDPPAV